jgi:extracellular matrix regulatory protein A
MFNIGFDTFVPDDSVLLMISPNTAPIKRKIEEAKKGNQFIDATFGKKKRCVVIMKNGYVILSAISAETLVKRFNQDRAAIEP